MTTLSADRRFSLRAAIATLALATAIVAGYQSALDATGSAVYGALQAAPATSGAALLAAAERNTQAAHN